MITKEDLLEKRSQCSQIRKYVFEIQLCKYHNEFRCCKSIFFSSILFLAILGIYAANSQEVALDGWRSATSLVDVISSDTDKNGALWCATSGGVFYYSPINGDFRFFNNTNGLYSSDAKIVKFNSKTNEIYIGTSVGVISIFDGTKWENILDIKNSSFPNPEILNFYFADSIVYIVGGFGITTFDPIRKVFLKTPSRLGNIQAGTPVTDCTIFQDTLWVTTPAGLAKISINKNIANPSNWQNLTQIDGSNLCCIKSFATASDTLYFFGDTTIYKWENGKIEQIIQLPSYDVINSVQLYQGKLLYSTPFAVRDLSGAIYFYYLSTQYKEKINGFVISKNNEFVLFLKNNGLLFFDPKTQSGRHFLPNSPASNLFTFICVDSLGAVWSATESDPRGQGIMRYYKGKWTNFNTSLFPQIVTNHYIKLSAVGSKIYASSFGSGLLEITTINDTFTFKLFDQSNSPLTGIVQDARYVVVQQTQYDFKDSLLWIVNYSNGKPGFLLIAKDNQDNFHPFLYQTERNYHHLIIDRWGTKWIASSDGEGLIFFNENGTLTDTTDDISGDLKRITSLPTSLVSSLAVDNFGYIWCGTSQGMFLIINPEAVLKRNVPIIRKLKVLADQPVFSIYVDPLNNKWVGTAEGVYVLSPDGFDIIANFNKENSPLLSNEILSITSNENNGVFYFGSRNGIVSANSLIIRPLQSFNISVYPLPFSPKKDKFMIIDGLAPQSEIKILTINGEIVNTLSTSSRKLLWDGRTYRGDYVTTGIYLISAKSSTSSESEVFKIAIINE